MPVSLIRYFIKHPAPLGNHFMFETKNRTSQLSKGVYIVSLQVQNKQFKIEKR